MNPVLTTIIIIVGIILIGILWYIITSNKLNVALVKIEEADSGIDVALTKRYDVLTKMLDVAKGYAEHEQEILTQVIKLRNGMTIEEKTEANNKMNDTLSKLKLVVENYPALKSSENYQALQLSITDVEEHLQAARRLYNSNVSLFNQMIVSFPTSIIAKNKKLEKKEFFETEEEKRQDVKMEF